MKKKKSENPEEASRKTLYTIKLDDDRMTLLEGVCQEKMWDPYEVDYARFAFKGPKVNVVGYKSGKVVIQGKGTEEFIVDVLEPQVTGEARFGYDEVHHPEWFESHAGLDESGKGDFFGPIVCATVIADRAAVEAWLKAGIRDSKKISDGPIVKLDQMIRATPGVVVEVVFCGMRKYNELMAKPGANVNRLMAWQHAKALEVALKKKPVKWGLLDQFSKQPLVQRYFKDTDFDLQMRTRAESDPVVAAASVVARAEYVRQMGKLSDRFGQKLQKGASARVKEQAGEIIRTLGPEALGDFAKLHFRTAHEVVDAEGVRGRIDLPPLKPVFERK
jgi:ribonuclease HIII